MQNSVNSLNQGNPPTPTGAQVNKKEGYGQTWVTLITELLFVAIPFVVIFIVLTLHDKKIKMLEMSEFAFAGIVLGGQAITKYVSGALAKRHTDATSRPRVTLLIATASSILIFFAGFILYRIVEIRETVEPVGHLSLGLITSQIVIFVVGIILFIILGGSGELARIRYEKQ